MPRPCVPKPRRALLPKTRAVAERVAAQSGGASGSHGVIQTAKKANRARQRRSKVSSPVYWEVRRPDNERTDGQACKSPGTTTPGSCRSSSSSSREAAETDGFLFDPNTDWMADAHWHFEVIYPALRRAEARPPATSSKCSRAAQVITIAERAAMFDWLVRVHEDHGLRDLSLFLAMHLADQFFASPKRRDDLPYWRHLLLAAAALLVASKFEEQEPLALDSLVKAAHQRFSKNELLQMELEVIQVVGYRLHIPTAAHHLEWLSRLTSEDILQCRLAHYLCELGLGSAKVATWSPSQHAAGCVLLSGVLLGRQGAWWPPVLQRLCAAKEGGRHEAIREILGELCRGLHQSTRRRDSLYAKFAKRQRGFVALKVRELAGDPAAIETLARNSLWAVGG
eukprot:gnl/TRDRNA2_/TRDRNA2_81646_c0_seq1.p1 gnl/TRDRNA2_/TRDRNA2_81646_c0~~gnl/TRDRNA2_/TRDRNA2_81646_c0_seq1.p1  ORF type:complete len:396 (-),score=56.18 gnl/TRDRNA2_/TRDRNA2_81646_c0_seq1:167-1354(-)